MERVSIRIFACSESLKGASPDLFHVLGAAGGGWSIRKRLVKWINPDATEVTLPQEEEKAYYDEKQKVWVFPGDDPDELVKPIGPPPMASTKPANEEPASEDSNPSDPLAAMMAPPAASFWIGRLREIWPISARASPGL